MEFTTIHLMPVTGWIIMPILQCSIFRMSPLPDRSLHMKWQQKSFFHTHKKQLPDYSLHSWNAQIYAFPSKHLTIHNIITIATYIYVPIIDIM